MLLSTIGGGDEREAFEERSDSCLGESRISPVILERCPKLLQGQLARFICMAAKRGEHLSRKVAAHCDVTYQSDVFTNAHRDWRIALLVLDPQHSPKKLRFLNDRDHLRSMVEA